MCLQEAPPVFAGELAALIRVQEQAGLRDLRRHTAASSACSTWSVCCIGRVAPPTTVRENRSSTTLRYKKPSYGDLRMQVMSVTHAWFGLPRAEGFRA